MLPQEIRQVRPSDRSRKHDQRFLRAGQLRVLVNIMVVVVVVMVVVVMVVMIGGPGSATERGETEVQRIERWRERLAANCWKWESRSLKRSRRVESGARFVSEERLEFRGGGD